MLRAVACPQHFYSPFFFFPPTKDDFCLEKGHGEREILRPSLERENIVASLPPLPKVSSSPLFAFAVKIEDYTLFSLTG